MADDAEKALFAPFTCPTCWKVIDKPEQQRIVVVHHDKERDIYHIKRCCRKCHPAPDATSSAKTKPDPKVPTN